VPPVTTAATGGVQAVLNPAGDRIRCVGSYTGLTATAAHLHTVSNGDVRVPFLLGTGTDTVTCDAAVSAADVTEMNATGWYANIHTSANPGGEIRGPLTPR
jgi:hypothetical protein